MCIISHKYKFIFIRVRKTASTSMHVALSKFCGPLDIIAHIGDKDQLESKPEQNNWKYLPSRNVVFYNHIPAFRIREMIAEQDKDIWDNYFKFCFERNPWDKVISQYYFQYQTSTYKLSRRGITEPQDGMSLNKFIMHGRLHHFSEWRVYTEEDKNDDTIIVDKVFKYEEMNEAFNFLKEKLNLPCNIMMPEKRFKGWTRKEHGHYRDILTNEERKRIADVFHKEIKEFKYEY